MPKPPWLDPDRRPSAVSSSLTVAPPVHADRLKSLILAENEEQLESKEQGHYGSVDVLTARGSFNSEQHQDDFSLSVPLPAHAAEPDPPAWL